MLSSQKKSSEQGQKIFTADLSINLTFKVDSDVEETKETSVLHAKPVVNGEEEKKERFNMLNEDAAANEIAN